MLDDSGDSYELIRAFLKDNYDINLYSSKKFNSDTLKRKFSPDLMLQLLLG
jgi:membrane-anchored protein YejM (alkaline phosphatase superfamily)